MTPENTRCVVTGCGGIAAFGVGRKIACRDHKGLIGFGVEGATLAPKEEGRGAAFTRPSSLEEPDQGRLI